MNDEEVRKVILQTFNSLYELQLKSIRQLLGEEDLPPISIQRRGRRRKSLLDLTMDLLTEMNRPMHVNEIVKAMLEKYGRVTDRDSLSSALGKKARQGSLIRQTSPATFELLKGDEDNGTRET
jgi:hypothetical protein